MTAILVCVLLLCAGCGKGKEILTTAPTTQPTTQPATTETTTLPEETEAEIWIFPEQTKISGVDVSGMDAQQAITAVNTALGTYVLEATVNEKTFQITAEQVALAISQESVENYARKLAEGETAAAPALVYDEALLTACIEEQCQVAATNASVQYIASADTFQVVKEKSGVSIDVKAAVEAVGAALAECSPTCTVTVTQKTLNPTVFSTDPRLQTGADSAKKYLTISLTYVFAPEQVATQYHSVTTDDIGKMISFNKDYVPYVNANAVSRYASSLNDKYAVRARFKTTGGGYISVNTSSISQAVDTASLAEDLKTCLETFTGGTRNAVYLPSTGTAALWNGNYVEIDLSRQHLWVYKNGECVVSTPVVTGCVAQDMETPTGVYSINYKSRNITLRGPTWNDFVYYWMPFFGNYGLHDATWRSEFGRDIYLYEGSHGCVNIPVDAAGKVYENVSAGTKVILYGGVTDVKLDARTFSGKTDYKVTPDAEPFRLDITSEEAPTFTYQSDNPQVAEVAEDGTVTVKGIGTANIIVSAPAHGRHAAGSVTVKITVAYDCSAGHTFQWTTTKEPTCKPGSQSGVCKCGHTENREIQPAYDHTWGDWTVVTEPGCEQEGKQTCTCSACGEEKSETIPSTGHDFTSGDFCANGCGTPNPVEPAPEPPIETTDPVTE